MSVTPPKRGFFEIPPKVSLLEVVTLLEKLDFQFPYSEDDEREFSRGHRIVLIFRVGYILKAYVTASSRDSLIRAGCEKLEFLSIKDCAIGSAPFRF